MSWSIGDAAWCVDLANPPGAGYITAVFNDGTSIYVVEYESFAYSLYKATP